MPEREYRARIPDEDTLNWIQTLLDCGFTTHEIDDIMMHLNDTYFTNLIGKEKVDDAVTEVENYFTSKGKTVPLEFRSKLRELVVEMMRKMQ
jgi:hypothetical protein